MTETITIEHTHSPLLMSSTSSYRQKRNAHVCVPEDAFLGVYSSITSNSSHWKLPKHSTTKENINKSSYIHRKSYKNIDESQKHFEQQQQKSQTLKIV